MANEAHAYVKARQQPVDRIEQAYDRILLASLINDVIHAYNKDALDVYQSALTTPGGGQLRVLSGIYVAHNELQRRNAASEAFGKVGDGLKSERLAMKFLFRPGSPEFVTERMSAH